MKKRKLEERYLDETSFFNKKAEIAFHQQKNFRLKNEKTYELLFSEIIQLKPVVSFFGNIRNKNLLDLGCGDGWASLYFARNGAKVFCCDISPKSIILEKKFAAENGLENKITAAVMPTENLCFGDNFLYFVFMNAALHHCDIEKVSKEMLWM